MAKQEKTAEQKRQDDAGADRITTPVTECATESRTKVTDTAHGKVKTTETRKR
jgi:hypothetical protein